MEVTQRGPGAEPLVGVRESGAKPSESSQHITNIWLPNYAQFCVFSQTALAAGKAREKTYIDCSELSIVIDIGRTIILAEFDSQILSRPHRHLFHLQLFVLRVKPGSTYS